MLIELGAKGKQIVNLDLDSHIVVRDILLRVGQSFGNNFADLTVFEVFIGSSWKVSHLACGSLRGSSFGRNWGSDRLSFKFFDICGEDSIVRSSSLDLI